MDLTNKSLDYLSGYTAAMVEASTTTADSRNYLQLVNEALRASRYFNAKVREELDKQKQGMVE